jgi:HSP20 family protein
MARSDPFEWFRREFASLFDRALPAWPAAFEAVWQPRMGLATEERENEYVVRAEVPGFEASELEVNLAGNILTIRAVHGEAPVEGAAVERPYGRLERTLTLPEGVNLEKVEARYHNGILEVHIPRTPEAQPRRIAVKT